MKPRKEAQRNGGKKNCIQETEDRKEKKTSCKISQLQCCYPETKFQVILQPWRARHSCTSVVYESSCVRYVTRSGGFQLLEQATAHSKKHNSTLCLTDRLMTMYRLHLLSASDTYYNKWSSAVFSQKLINARKKCDFMNCGLWETSFTYQTAGFESGVLIYSLAY
jgi:hypothetical protein